MQMQRAAISPSNHIQSFSVAFAFSALSASSAPLRWVLPQFDVALVRLWQPQPKILLHQLAYPREEIFPHLVVGTLFQLPLSIDLVVLRLACAEERGRDREVAIDGVLHFVGLALLNQLEAGILAELRMEFLLRHGYAREIAQRVEAAVEQILYLQGLRVVRDRFDHAELGPRVELERENRQRLLHTR